MVPSSDLEGFHQLIIKVSPHASFTTTIGSQLEPEDQEAVDPRAGRRPTAVARRPRSSTDLLAAYKYPSPHSTL